LFLFPAGDKVRVLGEGYTPDDEEDSAICEVRALARAGCHLGRLAQPAGFRAVAG
jgi:hypothetical protein